MTDGTQNRGAQGFAEMISKMAHELRSPLTSVKGFSATLVDKWDRFTDEQRRELIGTIHQDAERMGRIVSEVLDIARLEAGRLELARTEVDVAALVNKTAEIVASTYKTDRIDVEVTGDLTALLDSERFGHVLRNLIENAVRFSEEGPIQVRARAEDPQIVIEVTDQGVGIEPERLGAVFDGPGPTGQVATPRGTGLGLYLSKRLIDAHGGRISVESEVGSGSTFTVEIMAEEK